MIKFKSIIFDFDGVILDSANLKLEAFVEVYRQEEEAKRRSVREYARLYGGVSRRVKFEYFERSLFERTADEKTIDLLCSNYGDIVDDQIQRADFISGALESIAILHRYCKLHVVSGAPHDDLSRIIDDRKIRAFFTMIAGAPKSKFVAFKEILEADYVVASDVLAIGDSLTEFEAANELGIPFLAVVPDPAEDPFPQAVRKIADLRDLVAVASKWDLADAI